MGRSRKHRSDPRRYPACVRCGDCLPAGTTRWPGGRICRYCYLQALIRTGDCASCGRTTSLPGLDTTGQPTCTSCSGIPAKFTCNRCDRHVMAGHHRRCWWCVLDDLVVDALSGPDGIIPANLQPLANALRAARRPQSLVVWLQNNPTARAVLGDIAAGNLECSHAGLDELAASGGIEHLRALLVRHGVLPERDRLLADFHRWAATKLARVADVEQRKQLDRFLRWRLVRHLRDRARDEPLSHGPYLRAKQNFTVAIDFLRWLHEDRNHSLNTCTQHDIDAWFSTGPTTRRHALILLSWAKRQRILRDVRLPTLSTAASTPSILGSDDRLNAIRRLLLDEALLLPERIAGCLVTLYGQQVDSILALRTDDVRLGTDAVRIRLGKDWIDVAEPVADLLRRHLDNRRNMNTAANRTSTWLFPGQIAGEHRNPNGLRTALRERGIPTRASRLTAWRQLVRNSPPAILADALNISPATAMRHASLAGADWAGYASLRVVPASQPVVDD